MGGRLMKEIKVWSIIDTDRVGRKNLSSPLLVDSNIPRYVVEIFGRFIFGNVNRFKIIEDFILIQDEESLLQQMKQKLNIYKTKANDAETKLYNLKQMIEKVIEEMNNG